MDGGREGGRGKEREREGEREREREGEREREIVRQKDRLIYTDRGYTHTHTGVITMANG